MHYGNAFAEIGGKFVYHLRRKRNFRHHKYNLPAPLHFPLNKLHKNLRFAAARYAEKQRRFCLFAVAKRSNAVKGGLLFLRKKHLSDVKAFHCFFIRRAKSLLLIIFHSALFLKSVHNGFGGTSEIAYLFYAHIACFRKEFQHLRLFFRRLFKQAFAF